MGLAFVVFAGLIGLVIGWMISSGLFMLACKICRVSCPAFPRAMAIVFVVGAISFVAQFILGFMMGFTGAMFAADMNSMEAFAMFLGLGVQAIVASSFYSMMIPTSVAKGFLVWLTQMAMAVGFVLLLLVLFGGLGAVPATAP